eukprot:GHVS01104286.1.p1 GENE.GHVS01104286.1~~GHVS01104286.1.p1  ORF type:complete len:155 (+),score=44.18 GHVS01104286.1:184-648(+)
MSAASSQEKWLVFSKAAVKVFDNWTALSLAAENGWGGRESQQKKRCLVEHVIDLFRQGGSRIKVDKLSDLLFDRLLTNFSVEEEDDSAHEVAELLVESYNNCMKGDFSLCQQVASHRQAKVEECKGQDNVIAVLEEASDEMEGESSGEMEVEGT